jgi:hypothetical protein
LYGVVVALYLASAVGLHADQFPLNGTWRKWVDTESWVPIEVPFSDEPDASLVAYQRFFEAPSTVCGGTMRLHFDRVIGEATVYLNGVELGSHSSYTPFWFDVSETLNCSVQNELVVTINDELDLTTVPYADIAWVHYSGLAGDIYLESVDHASIMSTELQYELCDDYDRVDGELTVRLAGVPGTSVTVTGAILDGAIDDWTTVAALEEGSVIVIGEDGLASPTLTFILNDPELWSPDHPKRYAVFVAAIVEGETVDEHLDQTGFRDIQVQGNDVLLNGEPVFLAGITRHDIYPESGHVASGEVIAEDLLRIKATGANYLRLVHYGADPRVLDFADEIGLLVSEEVPAWANFWDPEVRAQLYAMLEKTIRRDMNHPSIFLWVTGNARAHPMPYGLEAQQMVKSIDRNRLCTFVIDNDEYDPDTIAQDVAFFHEAQLDIYMKISWWFYYVEYLQDAWTNFPKDIPLIMAEFGREGNDREPIVVDPDDGSEYWFGEDQQAVAINEMVEAWRPHLPMYDNEEHLAGMVLFNYQDVDWPDIVRYLPNHVPALHHGLVYKDREPKLALQVLTDFYSTLPDEFVGLPKVEDAEVETLFSLAENLGEDVNHPFRDDGPCLSADGRTMYFASDGTEYAGQLTKLYYTELSDGAWSEPELVPMPQETEPFAFRKSPCISSDGQTLFFTRAFVSGIYVADTRIWSSSLVDGEWTQPVDLGDVVNYSDASRMTADPSLSADGQTLYFTSDRPDGYGRADLWTSSLVDGEWTAPVNLGPSINTEFGEREPSISSDGSLLFFSSDRPGGLGSSDIWFSRNISGEWGAPKNLGPALNSTGADREPAVSADGKYLVFTGIREGGQGLSDIWIALSPCGRADLDEDADVDLVDFGQFQLCFTAGAPLADESPCIRADFDNDNDVDLVDFGQFQLCFGY